MAKKRTARTLATKSTKGTGKKPAKPSVAKPTKRSVVKPAKRAVAKQTKSPTKNTTIEAVASQATEEATKPENAWVVWQDGRRIWVAYSYRNSRSAKRPDTIVCDVIDRGIHQLSVALQRAIQLGQTLRQSYASYMKHWLQYDDAAQEQRIRKWQERM